MPRRRSSSRALKSWSAALRAALRMAGNAAVLGQRLSQVSRPKRSAAAKKKAGSGTDATCRQGTKATPARQQPARKPAPRPPLRADAVVAGRFRNAFGTRSYLLYPSARPPATGTRPPLIVLLHGCGQGAAGFAESTRMVLQAEAAGCWVVFPEQADSANRARCWNWFEPEHQRRGAGEPAILAGLVRKIVREHELDSRRVFVAGLSAGGAMAVVLGRTYPELFSGVGAYAGMPYGAARTAATALLAMRGRHRPVIDAASVAGSGSRPLRTVIFQGDRDRTVVPRNADEMVANALVAFGPLTAEREEGSAGGRSFERIRHIAASGIVAVEQWTIHGAGHAWSGGAVGAFSDTMGPDASAAMLNFFLQPRR